MSGSAVEMDPNLVGAAAEFLSGCHAGALGGVMPEMRLPEVPEDPVDLRRLVGELDEARGAFDRRFAEGIDGAAARLRAAVQGVRAADAAPVAEGH